MGWNSWEELILGAAVLRHGEQNWNVVVSELRARTCYPSLFTPEACKLKYEELQKRYSGSRIWFEELRKQCVAELKQKLARSEASIGFLESKIKFLEAEKQNSSRADYASSQTESPLPALNSDGIDSSCKKVSNGEHSAGSYTEDTRTRTSWLCEHHHPEKEIDAKPGFSVSFEHDKDSSTVKLAEGAYKQGVITKKKRGQRKRKDCNQTVKEGSVGESDNFGSSHVTQKEASSSSDYDKIIRDSGLKNHSRENLIEIFESIAGSEPASVFTHRLDSQKRARYKMIIRQHVDIGLIRSRIMEQSIKSAKELFRDLLLLANNALVFYSRRTREYKSAFALKHLVMQEYKQHCKGYYHEATSAFLRFNPHVKLRCIRPHPHPLPCKDKVLQRLAEANVEAKVKSLEKPCNSEDNVLLVSLLEGKKRIKQQAEKDKAESADKQTKRVSK